MDLLRFELKLAWRRLGRRKAHTTLILATFTLSIALALLSWSLFSTVFLRHPDFDPKGTLHVITQVTPAGGRERAFPQEVEAWAAHQQVFVGFGTMKQLRSLLVATPQGNERLTGTHLSTQALKMLHARPELGRLFTAAEDAPGSPPALLLSHDFWQRTYNGDPGVIGRGLVVDGLPATIVGVMPASFRFPVEQDLWASVGYDPTNGRNTSPVFEVLVELGPGVTVAQAEAELARISARTAPETGRRELRPRVMPLNDLYLSPTLRTAALVLFVLSAVFVLMSCANTANLVMVDFLSRGGDFGTSAALGVPRLALVRGVGWQVLMITGIATVGAAYAVWVAAPLVFEMAKLDALPYWISLSWGTEFWLVALGLGGVSAASATIAPALMLLTSDAGEMTRMTATMRGTGRNAWRSGLLAAQVALLTLLGCATGLLLKSQSRIAEIQYGFNPADTLTYRLALASEEIQGSENRRRAFERILAEVRLLPEVETAALSSGVPGVGGGAEVIADSSRAAVTDRTGILTAQLQVVTDEFFSALKFRWLAGDSFPREPGADRTDYAVITRGLAERLWPGQSAIGRTLFARQRSDIRGRVRELIVRGVVENSLSIDLLSDRQDGIYTHISRDGHVAFTLFARGRQGVPSADVIRQAIRRAESRITAANPRPLPERIEGNTVMLRLTARLTTIFTMAATLLGAVGLYSLTTALLAQRTREFGIRLTLGGTPRQLWAGFAASHLGVAVLGIAVGSGIAMIASPVLGALLYRVPARDVVVFVPVALGVGLISALSCLPSWRQLRKINPADCLRSL